MVNRRMKDKGLSTVVTTLIIITASVVLGTAVVLFASGIFQSSIAEEAITVSGAKLWGVNSTASQGAFIVKNTGSKELAIQSVKARGIESTFANWYHWNTAGSNVTTQTTLSYDTNNNLAQVTVGGASRTFTQATGPISLKPGQVYVVYLANPGGIDSTDAGSAISVEVSAKQATQVLRITVSSP